MDRSEQTIKLVLFDLGRVLADLGSPTRRLHLHGDDESFWNHWDSLSIVRSFERGDIDPERFLERLATEFNFPYGAQRLREHFVDWHPRLFPGANRLLAELSDVTKIALLSNTNTLHWDAVRNNNAILERFGHVFLSFELRRCKPEHEIFGHVLRTVGVSATDILFLDDLSANVAAAREFGIRSVQVEGIDQVRSALHRAGFDIT